MIPPKYCSVTDPSVDVIEDISNSYAIITCTSNSGAEAVIQGVPVYSFDAGSIVYDLSFGDLSEIDNLSDYNEEARLQWAYDIAYAQWTLEEVSLGLPHIRLGVF